jgi:ZIP family zinc transporter
VYRSLPKASCFWLVFAVLGAAVVGQSAMLFVIGHEIIPESHRKGHEAFATSGLMMLLYSALG